MFNLHINVYSVNTHSMQLSYENGTEDSTGGPVVKNPPSNAGNDGSIPDQRTKSTYCGAMKCHNYTTKTQHTHFPKKRNKKEKRYQSI